jgi:hypothetical protein
MMPWPKWVVLTAGSTGSALSAVRPSNHHIIPDCRRDLVYAARGQIVCHGLIVLGTGHRQRHGLILVARLASIFSHHPRCSLSQQPFNGIIPLL